MISVAIVVGQVLTHLHSCGGLLRWCHVSSIDAEVVHVVHGIELRRVGVTQKSAEIVYKII